MPLSETSYLWKKGQAAVFFACPIPHTLLTAAWKPFSTLFTVRRELKMAFFFLCQGLFWHRSPHDKTFPVMSRQVICLSLWYVMAQALASSTCFSVGQRLQIKYFARAWQQMSQPLLGICSFRFHQKDELSHWCQDMKCNLNVVIFDLKRIRSKELWKTYKTQGMPLLNSLLTDSFSAYLF